MTKTSSESYVNRVDGQIGGNAQMDTLLEGCTVVPNWLFDQVVRQGTCAQLKVTAAVIRYTLGTGYIEAKLTNSFLGWCINEGQLDVNRGVEESLKRGFIARRRFENDWAYRVIDPERNCPSIKLVEEVFVPDRKGRQLSP